MSSLALAGVLWLSPPAMADAPVQFADANLKDAVESALGISDPTPTEMLDLTGLSANSRGITDLAGLEYATNLTNLDLRGNQFSDISALSGMTSLRVLYLPYNNQISDISALSGMTSLTNLWLGGNQISDISVLSEMTSLTELRLDWNQISDISALSGAPSRSVGKFSSVAPMARKTL
ncbi:MAG: leucine-rich repeat domain-containing protein [Elusimicrobiota bacterium]